MRRIAVIGNFYAIKNILKILLDDSRTGHQSGNFLFFDYFPGYKVEHIRVIQIQTDHFGGASGGPAGFNDGIDQGLDFGPVFFIDFILLSLNS